ncbi:MAG: hypothetical protein FJ088_02985, partial [Deltaproteobacteria bacterium]|nr:hypothetical protein [Deltaproteobacteria bacterium]
MNSKFPRIISFALIISIFPLAFHLSLSWILGNRFLSEFDSNGIVRAERETSLPDEPVSSKAVSNPYDETFKPFAFIRIEHGVLDEYGLPLETRLKTSPSVKDSGMKEMEKALKSHAGNLRELGEKGGGSEVVVFDEGGYRFFARPLVKDGRYDGSAVVAAKSPPSISAFIFHGAAFAPVLSFLFILLFAALLSLRKNLAEKTGAIAAAFPVFAAISILYFRLKYSAAGMEKDFLFFLVFALSSAGIAGSISSKLSRAIGFFLGKPFILFSTAPAMTSVFILIFIPFFMGVSLAFLDGGMNFAGFAHFREIIF